jgi:hypothetical protein
MKSRYRTYRRASSQFYVLDSVTGKRESLRTSNPREAARLVQARNDAHDQPAFNLQLARMYLTGADPDGAKRTWQDVLTAVIELKHGPTRDRWGVAGRQKALAALLRRPLVDTRPNTSSPPSRPEPFPPTSTCDACKTSPSIWAGSRRPCSTNAMAPTALPTEALHHRRRTRTHPGRGEEPGMECVLPVLLASRRIANRRRQPARRGRRLEHPDHRLSPTENRNPGGAAVRR